MPDAAPASHAGNSCTDKITHPFYRLNLLPIPSYHSSRRGARPLCYFLGKKVTLCYFLGKKVTQKHFHTAAPLGRQYESAFARSRGGSPELPAAAVSRCSRPAPAGASAPPPPGGSPGDEGYRHIIASTASVATLAKQPQIPPQLYLFDK